MGQKQGVATTDTKKNGQVENCFFCTWSFANSIIANGNFTSIHIIHDSAVVDWKKSIMQLQILDTFILKLYIIIMKKWINSGYFFLLKPAFSPWQKSENKCEEI